MFLSVGLTLLRARLCCVCVRAYRQCAMVSTARELGRGIGWLWMGLNYDLRHDTNHDSRSPHVGVRVFGVMGSGARCVCVCVASCGVFAVYVCGCRNSCVLGSVGLISLGVG